MSLSKYKTIKNTFFIIYFLLGASLAFPNSAKPVSTLINSPIQGYCIPTYTISCSNEYISNVGLVGETITLDNDSTCSEDGYSDYTNLPPTDLVTEETYTLSVSTDYALPTFEQVLVWIDYNQDGEFSEDEQIASTNGDGLPDGTQDFEFTIPAGISPGTTRMRVRMVQGLSNPRFGPCENETIGEAEDYMVEIVQANTCEGVPTAGYADEDFGICSEYAFSLNVTGASGPANGLESIWQSSPAGEDNWTDIDGANSDSYIIEDGITEDMDYRYKVTCTISNETDVSDVIKVSLDSAQCYCIPSNSDSEIYYISNFSTEDALENINKSSGFTEGGYANYTQTDTIKAYPGQEITTATSFSSGNNLIEVWVDWNRNGDFSDEGENVISSNGFVSSPYTTSFTVPDTLSYGSTMRLRIRNGNIGVPEPCGEYGYGEAEDYTLKMIEKVECEGIPTAGIIDEDFSVCAGRAFVINVSEASDPWIDLDRIWQSSPEGLNDWTDIDGATLSYYSLENGILEATDFRYMVTCDNSGETDISDVLTVTLNPGIDCYCVPSYIENCDLGDRITNVSLTGETVTLDNDSECSDDGYGDYTNLTPPDLAPGETYTLSVSTDYIEPTYQQARVWIDYDQNGYFSNEEEIANTNGEGFPGGIQNFNFTVNEDVSPGNYRMRIRMVYDESDFDDCSDEGYGEVEDYLVNVALISCPAPTDLSVEVENTTIEVNWTANGSETEWELIYGAPGFNPEDGEGESVFVQNNPATITDLDLDTDYEIYVRAICGQNDQSLLEGPVSFSTGVLSVDTPSFETFTFYPNPTQSKLNLSANMPINRVTLHNTLGQQVIDVRPESTGSHIDLEGLQTGVYFMKVTINGTQKSFKIIRN